MENENSVNPQDEIKEEETFEVDESEEETDDTSSEDDENSTQLQDELEKLKADNAKLQRLLKKTDKSEKSEESKLSEQPSGDYVTKQDLERIRLEAKGYDDDQINFLMKFGGSEALKEDAVAKVVEQMKEQKRQINAQATSTTQSKGTRKYTQKELQAMPVEKLEKLIREGKIK